MDALEIDGKEYISARRAAKEHGYVADYIGQLIRGGKLIGKKVGRAWYVEVDSLAAYMASAGSTQGESSNARDEVSDHEAQNTSVDDATEDVSTTAETDEAPSAIQLQTRKPEVPSTSRIHEDQSTGSSGASGYELLTYLRDEEAEEEALPELNTKPLSRPQAAISEAVYYPPIEEPREEVPVQAEATEASSVAWEEPASQIQVHSGSPDHSMPTPVQGHPHRSKRGGKALAMGGVAVLALFVIAFAGILSIAAKKEITFDGSAISASVESFKETLNLGNSR